MTDVHGDPQIADDSNKLYGVAVSGVGHDPGPASARFRDDAGTRRLMPLRVRARALARVMLPFLNGAAPGAGCGYV
ncbi:MAG TPA: hypothetical protein VGO89_15565 [Streptomyces sp.]|nr:hypothetical protein [Streptomyces sp.]